MKSTISIVIPNYNGLSLLQRHLHSVVDHAGKAEIILVDDASTDDSVSWVKSHFPSIRVFRQATNQGFARSVNRGFSLAHGDLVLLLNNDVSINQNTIKHLLPHFSDPQVFAVGALEKLPRGHRRGKSQGFFRRGFLVHRKAPKLIAGPTLWVFAASGMFRRSIWQKLGGLDPLYWPAYWEDIDLSYRAWKSGYHCLFEPAATVIHDHEATMNQVLAHKKLPLAFKNQILFYWKNITDLKLILLHLLWMPYHIIITSLKTRGAFFIGFLLALHQVTQVFSQKQSLNFKLTDHQVIQKANQ